MREPNLIEQMAVVYATEIEQLTAKLDDAKSVIRDLLSSYLATFSGNKDDLALRAERILEK